MMDFFEWRVCFSSRSLLDKWPFSLSPPLVCFFGSQMNERLICLQERRVSDANPASLQRCHSAANFTLAKKHPDTRRERKEKTHCSGNKERVEREGGSDPSFILKEKRERYSGRRRKRSKTQLAALPGYWSALRLSVTRHATKNQPEIHNGKATISMMLNLHYASKDVRVLRFTPALAHLQHDAHYEHLQWRNTARDCSILSGI